ncbi:MAG: hypothetical protein C5S48_09450 [Candidatus Methanogaster sp.]|nr:MAG: hypothetical protein C5S48_09450 [ANME-2 cluster archaeon]
MLYMSFGNSYLTDKLNYRRFIYHNHVHLFVTSHNPQNRVSMILHVMKNVEDLTPIDQSIFQREGSTI